MGKRKIETETLVEEFAKQLVAAAETAEESRMAVCDALSGNRQPNTAEFWRDLSAVYDVIADYVAPLIHEKRCWLVFALAEKAAMHVVEERQHVLQWESDLCKWPLMYLTRDLYGACLAQANWTDPSVRRIALESLEELAAQKVNDLQICKLFAWEKPDGSPDKERLRAARAGEVPVPTYLVAPAAWPSGWPAMAPIVSGAAHFAQWLHSELADAEPVSEADVFEYGRELS